MRRQVTAWARRAGLASGAALITLATVAWVALPGATDEEASAPEPVVAFEPASGAAAALVERRIAAISAGDGAALLATTDPTSAARDADAELVASLDAGAARYEGLQATIGGVDVIADDGTSATVRVTYALSPHVVEQPDGRVEAPASVVTAVVEMVWGADGWAVSAIREET